MNRKKLTKEIEKIRLWELDRNKNYIIFVPKSAWTEKDQATLSKVMADLGFEGVVVRIEQSEKIRVIQQKKRGGEKK
jgi:hypothetical protein